MNSLYNQLNTQNQRPMEYSQPNNLDRIKQMMNFVKNSRDPRIALESMIQSNPQMQNVMDMVRQNGGDPKAAFLNLAKQKGVDPNDILNMLR